MRGLGVTALACAVLAAGACNKQEKQYGGLPPAENWQAPAPGAQAGAQPGAQAGAPDPHAGMANPHGGMANPHAGMDMNDPHAGMDMNDPHAGMDMGNPHGGGMDVTQLGLEGPDPNRTIDPSKFLKGTIKPTSDTKARIPNGSVIFLSVKQADPATGKATGAPLAVERLQLTGWPLWFNITEANAMVSGTQFSGDVVITAWSDQDQDAISKQPGDVRGEVKAKIPGDKLEIVLDTVVQ